MPPDPRGYIYPTKNGFAIRWRERGERPAQDGFKTKAAAQRWFNKDVLPRLLADQGPAQASEIDPDTTLAAFCEMYLAAHSLNIEPSSLGELTSRLRRATESFGDVPLRRLEHMAPQIASWRGTLAEGSRYGATNALRQALEQAVRWKVISQNPAKLAGKNPQPKRAEIVPFSRDELDRICAEMGPEDAAIVTLAAATGLMPSEWFALERRDVRREEGVLLVERSFSGGKLKGYGKTSGRRRPVPLSRTALGALDLVPPRLDTKIIFPAALGGHESLHNWRARTWYPALKLAGVDHGTPYTLRHTYATRALAAGITVFELSRYMGTSVEMIDRTYGHLAHGSAQAAAAKLDALDEAGG